LAGLAGNNFLKKILFQQFLKMKTITPFSSKYTLSSSRGFILGTTQNSRQKVFTRGALRLCRRAWHCEKLIKTQVVCSVSHFNSGELGTLFGGDKLTRAPHWWRNWQH